MSDVVIEIERERQRRFARRQVVMRDAVDELVAMGQHVEAELSELTQAYAPTRGIRLLPNGRALLLVKNE